MATPPILDDAAPGDAPDADADALLTWPEICDLMNLQAPDAWRPRHAAVLAVRRRARDEGGLDGRPPDLFSLWPPPPGAPPSSAKNTHYFTLPRSTRMSRAFVDAASSCAGSSTYCRTRSFDALTAASPPAGLKTLL